MRKGSKERWTGRIFSLLLLAACLFEPSLAFSEVRLPSVLGSHMVLRQNSQVKLWGWCEPNEEITVRVGWDPTVYTTKGLNTGKWSVEIKTPQAGGPYSITISGRNTVTLEDVMIGEVWTCSGQSNMEWSGTHGVKQAIEESPHATNTNIRLFYVPKAAADYPQEDCKGSWKVSNPEDMKRFSAVGYFFGKKLQQELRVPIGLINSNWGGTPAEVWTPRELVENDPALKEAAQKQENSPSWPVNAGATFNGMINPLTNFLISGVIWYQGESNVETYSSYQSLFTMMIGAWRRAWRSEFPFYYVQIAPFSGYERRYSAALLREAQTKSMSCTNTGMVVVSDLVDDIKDIHPQNKMEVGRRLANYALAETYEKKGGAYKSPTYKGMKVENGKIRISFDNAENGLISRGGEPKEFYIAAEDRIFLPASAMIENSTVVVWNPGLDNPAAVRFAFGNAVIPNLFSAEGLPVNLFRTDDWPIDTDPLKQ